MACSFRSVPSSPSQWCMGSSIFVPPAIPPLQSFTKMLTDSKLLILPKFPVRGMPSFISFMLLQGSVSPFFCQLYFFSLIVGVPLTRTLSCALQHSPHILNRIQIRRAGRPRHFPYTQLCSVYICRRSVKLMGWAHCFSFDQRQRVRSLTQAPPLLMGWVCGDFFHIYATIPYRLLDVHPQPTSRPDLSSSDTRI